MAVEPSITQVDTYRISRLNSTCLSLTLQYFYKTNMNIMHKFSIFVLN